VGKAEIKQDSSLSVLGITFLGFV